MRKAILTALLCFLLIPIAFVSCTTSDSAEDIESAGEELDADFDESSTEDASNEDSVDSIDEEATEDSSVAATDESESGDPAVADAQAPAATEASADEEEEDADFFAEDADPPKEAQGTTEKDLQNELQANNNGATTTVATSEAPPAEASAPAAVEAPPSATAAPVAAADAVTSGGEITSKETPITTKDGFEVIAPTVQVPNEDLGISDPLVADVDPPLPAEKVAMEVVPVSKIRKEPFYMNQRLMNTVYIARQGDDPGTISQKIFNKDNVAILIQDNRLLADGVSVGDQVYYNSPNRSEDKKEILTYYQDKKMAPQYYTTKRGDSIQKIGREVLGHDEAWREVWATNEILQSQAMLPAGLKIKYWSGNEVQAPPDAPTLASTENIKSSNDDQTALDLGAPPAETLESLPDMSQSMPTEDPVMSSESSPMPSNISVTPPMPAATIAQAESESSLITIAGISLIGLAVVSLIAIQIKNRKRDDGNFPPSLEFTKV